MRLTDKVAIVTGGASGIGAATVRDMVAEGAEVLIADLDDQQGEQLAQELDQKEQRVIYHHADVSQEEQVAEMIKRAEKEWGRLDIIFSNAGIGDQAVSDQLSLAQWQQVIDINLTGVFLSAKHAIPLMKQDGGGSIVNCSSILGHVGQAETASYTAAKGGVTNLTRALAAEYAADGIRVNAVCPGYIDTPLIADLDDEVVKQLISLHPLGRLGQPEEIAKAVTFLASDDASFITGENLLVDGGYTAV
ncbi:MAG: SDR family NAD(P)-dependent oxidoreductase [Bacillota bacterium]